MTTDLERRPFAIPMRTRFRGVDRRVGVLVRGSSGWGEFSPFPEYPPHIASRWWSAAVEAATRPWPTPLRSRIPVNVTVPAIDPGAAYALVAASGCSTAKVKVAEGADLARVEAVRDALGPKGRLRIDVNGAWDVDTAVRMIRAMTRFDLEYVEQPVATIAEMRQVRARVEVALAADEVVRQAPDPLHVDGIEVADLVVLKVQPLGGVGAALAVADAIGLPVVVSSAIETSIGLAAGVALAAALPDLPYACGLGTATMLAGDVVAQPLTPVDGHVDVRRPDVDDAALARWTPHDEEAAAVLERAALAETASA